MKEGMLMEIPGRIPIEKRNPFQITLMKMMLGADKTVEAKIAWADAYGKTVSDIVDDPENAEIRRLIMDERYEEAAEIVGKMLK